MCKVSVIVPFYNAEKFLDKCINSVLKQTYDDFELILVNDGSTDGSQKICEKYSNIYIYIYIRRLRLGIYIRIMQGYPQQEIRV